MTAFLLPIMDIVRHVVAD